MLSGRLPSGRIHRVHSTERRPPGRSCCQPVGLRYCPSMLPGSKVIGTPQPALSTYFCSARVHTQVWVTNACR